MVVFLSKLLYCMNNQQYGKIFVNLNGSDMDRKKKERTMTSMELLDQKIESKSREIIIASEEISSKIDGKSVDTLDWFLIREEINDYYVASWNRFSSDNLRAKECRLGILGFNDEKASYAQNAFETLRNKIFNNFYQKTGISTISVASKCSEMKLSEVLDLEHRTNRDYSPIHSTQRRTDAIVRLEELIEKCRKEDKKGGLRCVEEYHINKKVENQGHVVNEHLSFLLSLASNSNKPNDVNKSNDKVLKQDGESRVVESNLQEHRRSGLRSNKRQ